MNHMITVGAVRLALGVEQLRAETAARNLAQMNIPGHRAQRVDATGAINVLQQIADGLDPAVSLEPTELATVLDGTRLPTADESVADMVEANLRYQELTEAISRQFALTRLAINGRS